MSLRSPPALSPPVPMRAVYKAAKVASCGILVCSAVYFSLGYYRKNIPATARDYSTPRTFTLNVPDPMNPYRLRPKEIRMMTMLEASKKLSANQESHLVTQAKGIWRYDVNALASNDPIEDDHVEQIIRAPDDSHWFFYGIFDGHSGWYTSDTLKKHLVPYVARELDSVYQSSSSPSEPLIGSAIKSGFVRLDNEIVNESVARLLPNLTKSAAADLLMPALSGSCGLVAFFDNKTNNVRVACTGDSRAVLGTRDDSGVWIAKSLSVDQTGSNFEEAERIRREHPGEDKAVWRGRVLGSLEPTRAFGDAKYKWSIDVQRKLEREYFGRPMSDYCKTPPYVTAEPVVTTTKIDTLKDNFMVIATDGLWECLSNEEVVGLVGKWLDKKSIGPSNSWIPNWFAKNKEILAKADPSDKRIGQKDPHHNHKKKFAFEDDNAATHLIRNALGGSDKDQLCSLLSLPSPMSRNYRDDITVTVVFFGNNDQSSSNDEFIARHGEFKAKL